MNQKKYFLGKSMIKKILFRKKYDQKKRNKGVIIEK
jgi:hypothetical protein